MSNTASTAKQPRKRKHIPLRRCVACRKQRPQAEMLRFFKDSDGQWQFDKSKKSAGRGAWVCADNASCHEVKKLGRFFRAQVEDISKQLKTINSNNTQMEV